MTLRSVLWGVIGAAVPLAQVLPQAPAPAYIPLQHVDRVRLVQARLAGDRVATVRVATRLGAVPAVAQAIETAGGVVRFRDDALGYLRARLPTVAVLALAARDDIMAINVNATNSSLASADEATTFASRPGIIPPPDSTTPAANPYMPVQDLGSPQFIRAHPTYDGRGVTIGIVEAVGDPSHPTLQTARTLDGQPVRKVAAIDVAPPDLPGVVRGVGADSLGSDSAEARPRFRVAMRDSVVVRNGSFQYRGRSYRAPRDGSFRMGRLGNVGIWFRNRVGPALLWARATGEVWVDVHNANDFTAAPALHDFNATGEYGWLGENDPATIWDDRPTITLLLHPADETIDCWIAGYVHTVGVSAVAAGNRIYGGAAHGVAPQARLVWVAEATSVSQEEDFIRTARGPDVDVLTNQIHIAARLRDNHTVFSIVVGRLAAETRKVFFESMTNAPPYLNNAAAPALADGILGIAGYIKRESRWVQYGLRAPKPGSIAMRAGAAGPASDGGFGTFALAPAAYVVPWAPTAVWRDTMPPHIHTWVNRGLYPFPVTYRQGAGTSYTAPAAAGVAALLISAARQAQIPYDGPRLRLALAAGAVPIPGEPVYRQGNGLLNVERAWVKLQRLATLPDPVTIQSAGPVHTVLSHELATPNLGRGLFEREGWTAGDTATRTVTLTRTTGPDTAQEFTLRWRANDGTYGSATQVVLPLNAPVPLSVRVAPRTPGAHSAVLEVIDPHGTVVHRMMATVVAALPLTNDATAPASVVTRSFAMQAPFLEHDTRFVRIPAGLDSLTVRVTFPSARSVRLSVNGPSGVDFQNGTPKHGESVRWGYATKTSRYVTLVYPEPGVWELGIENENDSLQFDRAQLLLKGTLTVTGYRAPMPPTATVTRLAFGPGDTATSIPLDVDFTTRALHVRLVNPSADADLDLYLVRCVDEKCTVAGLSTIRGAEKAIAVDGVDQQPGNWRILVDPVRVPQGGVTVEWAVLGGARSAVADPR